MSKKAKNVTVRLLCILSGHPGDPGPGSVVSVDAATAEHLVAIGGAEVFSGEAAQDSEVADAEGEGEAEAQA